MRPKIHNTYGWATFLLTLTRSTGTFAYGNLVRSINLSNDHPLVNQKDQFVAQIETPRLCIDEHQSPITVSTSSLLQMANKCQHITTINLSRTVILHDKLIAETGEYLSTLQCRYVRPGLTQIDIPMEEVIKAIGHSCQQLETLEIRQTRWVTAEIIWLFVYHCPQLKRLDARRSPNCSVKKLATFELVAYDSQLTENHSTENIFEESSDSEDYFGDHIQVIAGDIVEPGERVSIFNTFRFEAESFVENFLINESLAEENRVQEMMEGRSLKEIVRSILINARNAGSDDLAWLDAYI
ncbi:hypothetical protein G6F43_006612 [Rhizopus delemar]|nr:hypothetical protein G6F43_006612 [Rhizopus delemar]